MNRGARVLRIDLATRKTSNTEEAYYVDKFLGGRGINRWILLKEIGCNTSAYSPDNKIVFGTGLLTGTSASGSGRLQVDTVSPFNNGVASSNGGGAFAPKLKFAGWDHLVLENTSQQLCYICIDNNQIDILPAEDLRGRTTWETHDILQDTHGKDFSVLCIGPAGEKLVNSAAIIIDKYRAAARCGVGAVMGSKRVKAIMVRGSGAVEPVDRKAFEDVSQRMKDKIQKSEVGQALEKVGTAHWLQFLNALSWSPVRNFQDCYVDPELISNIYLENWKDIESSKIEGCYNCPANCGFLRTITGGAYKGTEAANVQANAFWDFSTRLDIYDPAVVIKALEVCNRYGLDIDSVSGSIAWAYECFEQGIINEKDTDGLRLTWGNDEALMQLLKKIAVRDGFGDLLAEGCNKASKKLGAGSEKYCVHVKGQDLKEPVRTVKGWALGVMVSPRAGTHTRGCPETEIYGISREDGERYYGVPAAGDPLSYEGKAKLVVYFEREHALCDSLGVCNIISEWNGLELPGVDEYVELASAFLGKEISRHQLLETAERIVTVEKYFNQIHSGFTREDDYPPQRLMTEPVRTGPHKGERLDKGEWGKMLDEYYQLHKWDMETGTVPEGRLKELDLV